jgi:hypothetical protein
VRVPRWLLLLVTPTLLAAQHDSSAADSGRVLLLEHRFAPGDTADVVVTLERQVVYWVDLTGPGTPLIRPLRAHARPAFLIEMEESAGAAPRRFEVHALHAGPHRITLSDLPPGTETTLRLYRDTVETRRIALKRDRQVAFGVLAAAGLHSGYRLDPSGGADPRGGTDVEGCILVETGGRLGSCLGMGRQSFPSAGFGVTWVFLEMRSRLVSGHMLGGHRTDLGATLRYSQALGAGPRDLDPALLSIGLYVTQHLTSGGRRLGWSLVCAWQHGRLGDAPETERLDTNRFTAGLAWIR